MIRSPMVACGERRLETAAVVVTLVLALFVPSVLGLGAILSHDAGKAWLEAYRPIVYLHPDTSNEGVDRLVEEVSGWHGVERVDVRRSKDSFEVLSERLGADDLDALGVTPSMFPVSLEIVPRYPVAGHVDLVASVSALEARMEVDAVDVPGAVPLRLVSMAHVVGLIALLLGILALVAAGIALFTYLIRIRESERDLEAVLGIFGAYPAELRRASLIRGGVLGLWSGLGVALLLGAVLAIWQAQAPATLGLEGFISIWTWPLVSLPVLVGPGLGIVVGFAASKGHGHRTRAERAAIFA